MLSEKFTLLHSPCRLTCFMTRAHCLETARLLRSRPTSDGCNEVKNVFESHKIGLGLTHV